MKQNEGIINHQNFDFLDDLIQEDDSKKALEPTKMFNIQLNRDTPKSALLEPKINIYHQEVSNSFSS